MAYPDYNWSSASPMHTVRIGRRLSELVDTGLCIGLIGPLGAGKTLLVRGMAAGNLPGGAPEVTSPTFTLINEYSGRLPLYHLDVYRLKSVEELRAIGFDDLLRNDAIVVVEWADRVRELLPDDTLWIELTLAGDTERTVIIRPGGPVAADLAQAVDEALATEAY